MIVIDNGKQCDRQHCYHSHDAYYTHAQRTLMFNERLDRGFMQVSITHRDMNRSVICVSEQHRMCS